MSTKDIPVPLVLIKKYKIIEFQGGFRLIEGVVVPLPDGTQGVSYANASVQPPWSIASMIDWYDTPIAAKQVWLKSIKDRSDYQFKELDKCVSSNG